MLLFMFLCFYAHCEMDCSFTYLYLKTWLQTKSYHAGNSIRIQRVIPGRPPGLLRTFIVYTEDIHRRSGYKASLEGTNVNAILRQSEYMRGPRDLEGECSDLPILANRRRESMLLRKSVW